MAKKIKELDEQDLIILTPEEQYERALARMEEGRTILQAAYKEENFLVTARIFEELGDIGEAPAMAAKCRELAALAHEEGLQRRYDEVVKRMNGEGRRDWRKLAAELEELGDFKDAGEKLAVCRAQVKAENRGHTRKSFGLIASVLVVIGAIVWFVLSGGLRYVLGIAYLKTEKYTYARASFEKAGSFANARQMADKSDALAMVNAGVGSNVTFGQWRWYILDRDEENGTALMIATTIGEDHPCYSVPFNEDGGETTWEESSLRAWLNGPFLEEAFDEKERAALLPRQITASVNPRYGTAYEAGEEELLAPLSAEEAEQYMELLTALGNDCWLRTPGEKMSTVCYITGHHAIMYYGVPSDTQQICVRPVIRVDLNSLLEK